MVQRKLPSKLGIKTHLLKSETQLVNLIKSSSSPQTHDKLNNKIMKKPRLMKRVDEPPFKKKKTRPSANHEPCSTPNYMKSTSSFDARKEQSPKKLKPNLTPTPSPLKMSKTDGLVSGRKGSRTSSLKMVRSLTKTPSFKPLRPSKKVILCEDLDAQRATCSSTLKDSKFPDYLQLNHGGNESEGTSAMKVCSYTYCSLNGHHHDPLPPLKRFLSAKRRALSLKTHKSFKLGCLSPKSPGKKNEEIVKNDMKSTPVTHESEEIEEESKDFFFEIYIKEEGKKGDDFECSNIDWEEGYCSASCSDDVSEERIQKGGDESLYGELQELYDEESVSSGAWSDEDVDSESDSLYKINQPVEDQDFLNGDAFEVSRTTETDLDVEIDEIKAFNLPIGDQNINFQQEETCQESKTIPDFEKNSKEGSENRTTIIYNIIQFNISVFINGEKTEDSEMDTSVGLKVPATCVVADKMETEEVKEAMEEQSMSDEYDEASELNQMVEVEEIPFDDQDIESNEQSNASNLIKKQDDNDFEQDCKEYETDEVTPETDIKVASFCKKSDSSDDLREFNPRGPNLLPEVEDPDAETVDLRHQMMDERKNAEEWMVDFALQQAVTTLAPARKRKVALLVEAFEKVMPIPKYETHNRHASKAFANARPMQACN